MRLKCILLALCTLTIIACSSDGDERRQQYLDADYYTRLELPPDLTEPSTTQQLSVPKPTDAAMEKFKADSAHLGKIDSEGLPVAAPAPVLPTLKGVELKSEAGLSWLEVDSSAEKLWPQLAAFWSQEGIAVVQSQPLLGLIETDWVNKLQVKPDASWLKRIFSTVEPERLDKFRMRIASIAGEAKTRVYVSHSGMEVVVEGEDVSWRARYSEAGLEQEILSRLALYLGLGPNQAKRVLASYTPYASRVTTPVDETSSLYLNDTLDLAWQRTQRALDRLGTDIQESDESRHQFKIALTKQESTDVTGERDELAESSWLMQWLKSSNTNAEDRQFMITLAQEKSRVKLSILTLQGAAADSVLAEQFRKALALELQ